MKHGSLFSGIGGFDLAAQWMGWENVFSCEINEFGNKILNHYWPDAIHYKDINETDFTIHRGSIDILTGGFPCQPFSQAGKRKGTEDDRHLWPRMLEVIREVQPRWVVGENVSGLINWDGGLVFDQVQIDLENEGYQIQPVVLPAASVGAPHRRDRVWFVAYNSNTGIKGMRERKNKIHGYKSTTNSKSSSSEGEYKQRQGEGEFRGCSSEVTPNADSDKRPKGRLHQEGQEKAKRHISSCDARGYERADWENFPTQPPICSGNDGLSARLDGITFPKWRNESIKAYGNAVVPSLVYEIFKVIEQYEQINK